MLSSEKVLQLYFHRLVKTVLIVVNVEGKCLLISVPSASILRVLTRTRTIAINVEFAGMLFFEIYLKILPTPGAFPRLSGEHGTSESRSVRGA